MNDYNPCMFDPNMPCQIRQEADPDQPIEDPNPDDSARLTEAGVTYPRVLGIINPFVETRVNEMIRRAARKYLPPVDSYTDIITAQSSYEQTLRRNHILSLRFENFYYQYHAAHPMTYVSSITLNLRTGQVYSLADLFDPRSNYKVRLTQIIQQQITARDIPMLTPFKGITGNEEFYLMPDKLVIYYQLYEYTPYVYGILEFPIPYVQIRDIINETGPIGQITR